MALEQRLAEVWQRYRDDQPLEGIALARALVAEHPDHGEPCYALACCLERSGDLRRADTWFARAARARTEPQGRPYRVSWTGFTAQVDRSAGALPEQLRNALGEVTLVLADYADPCLLTGHDEPELLGLFMGTPKTEREQSGVISPVIHLWRRAHEHWCQDRHEFAAEVRQTLWHELGHYLGYDEDELDALGRG